ncbi:glycosyltransferase family 2 protein [Flavihumibacter fluvii]|uniref:glycosyltransferase family 2 protein n=1 Tax=Flavihumibacter fluvii TaxID=2838157 RepID=UPI001BDEE78A|nr:glycosyltransferase [Flavihumibacter fluvii]ULQ52430.1 glycosyltransferase [Flavihumibacter fluvii]
MIERTPQTPPVIKPVESVERPLWSVMIPSYNCLEFLRDAIESVLVQDLGPEKMQIEVIDDASTEGDVEALVKEVGKGRVSFFRQETNVGSLRNFETCLNRSRGYYIHLLHGDDMVKPGFYMEIGRLFAEFPTIGAAFCKNSFMNKYGNELTISGSVLEHPGIIPNWLEQISLINLCQPPAVVVKRSVYEHLGSFFAGHYGEDWEMWCRIAANYEVAYTPKCLAMYRSHPENITTRSHMSGQSIRDIETFINIIQGYLPAEKRRKIKHGAKRNFSNLFSIVASKNFYGDQKRYLNLAYKSFMLDQNKTTILFLTRIVLSYLTQPGESKTKQ